MGNKSSIMLQDEEIKLISQETGFSPTQIEKLYTRFTSLDKEDNGSLSRDDFLRVPELAINPLCDRIVQMFFADCDEDHDRINFRQFMKVLAVFKSTNKSNKSSRNPSRQENEQNNNFALPKAVKDFNNRNKEGENIHHQTLQSRHNNLAPTNSHLTVQRKFSQENSIATLLGRSFSQDGLSLRSLSSFDQDDHASNAIQSSFHRPHHQRHSSNDGFLNYYQHHHHTTNQHSVHYAAGPSQPSLGHNQLALIDIDEPPNSRKQKLYFMFKIYDVDNDNRISLNDLQSILKMMVGNFITDSQIAKISNRVFGEADLNCDGSIDFDEFCRIFDGIDLDEKLKIRFSH